MDQTGTRAVSAPRPTPHTRLASSAASLIPAVESCFAQRPAFPGTLRNRVLFQMPDDLNVEPIGYQLVRIRVVGQTAYEIKEACARLFK